MNRTNPALDFIIIGAPKAGTTSLFEYLRTHPEIHLPQWKETNFFLDPSYQRGVDWYLDWVLGDAPAEAVCGEASVRYMAGTPRSQSVNGGPPAAGEGLDPAAVIPTRIHEAVPDVRLIALLRDPVSRCVSEHGMAVLRGTETRSVDAAVEDLLRPERIEEAHRCFSPTNCYVSGGEYGRILSPFFERFPADRILVLYTSDLAADAEGTVKEVCRFVGVDDTFVPPNLGTRYLEGAQRPRHKALDLPGLARALRERESLRTLWRRVPTRLRQRAWTFSYRVEKWNRADDPPTEKEKLSEGVEAALREHFRPDRDRLASLVGTEPPWR